MSDDISCPFKMKRAGGMKGCVGNMKRMQNTTDDDVGGEGLSIIIFQSPEVIHQCMMCVLTGDGISHSQRLIIQTIKTLCLSTPTTAATRLERKFFHSQIERE